MGKGGIGLFVSISFFVKGKLFWARAISLNAIKNSSRDKPFFFDWEEIDHIFLRISWERLDFFIKIAAVFESIYPIFCLSNILYILL